MDILAIAKIISPLAPVAGSIIGGLIGGPAGAAIGGKLASFVLGQFGLPATATPAQVNEAVTSAGEETARAKINAAMELARAEIAGFVEVEKAHTELLTKTILGTQETMRAEILPQNRHWFFTGWRPACGWVLVVHAFTFGCMLAIATFRAAFFDNAVPLNALSDAWKIYLAYFGALGAVVGVAIFARSEDKKHGVDTSTVPAKVPPPLPKVVPAEPPRPVPASPTPVMRPPIGKPPGSRD